MVSAEETTVEELPRNFAKFLPHKNKVVKRPSVKDYIKLHEANNKRFNNEISNGDSFRNKKMYWGRFRSVSGYYDEGDYNADNIIVKNDGKHKTSKKHGRKLGKAFHDYGQHLENIISKTVEQFEKERGYSDVAKLLNVSRNYMSEHRELSTQMEKLTFMISEIMQSGASQAQLEAEVKICCILSVKMWPIENKVPLSTTSLVDLLRMTRSWKKRAPDRPETKPTIILSHNGYSRCGIFIAANVCIDQMDMDREVDVFHAVKMIRINRPQLIDIKDEYKYLYDLMLHWYMTSPEYRIYDNDGESTNTTEENTFSLSSIQKNENQPFQNTSSTRSSTKERKN
ncbi:Protein-tyrosine phosphatase, receptor/non-receptor type domain and Protein-tyrosine/Dual specificity phosphatase domain and Protein-tyrosine phosphatase, catalytic domain-containing protein [Strongyloides ratti]|uniref:Protein-tyrosine phosphatase, receptor/non-receptor type domain and Protein-tyrosine/Dual specificity phosphatase domain and Protein-tyrosine phosphatase, catalytic domain-containing protein n=1 Tax=Strongyloides ratti TaxID=34506 RepID=A0A090LTB2_STRRB|nr:Protein-tyrosine phosphatase, receptor/non-receptor type domain and Protein-tyrosine/Dual specificity phosphatase domain and Protein-tyrosine phosphatase, catalytic domain-containing protein [Strongyloides ratti]CEF70849.1 Protein-tyrosine phosphatase, receptor/non-receptor type domain and Protein-tyrosine/Dual specificity phosphatase domain and Protein-tyrosine phosphatase, catalytic domain-containing protein [Strongyloides ratti]